MPLPDELEGVLSEARGRLTQIETVVSSVTRKLQLELKEATQSAEESTEVRNILAKEGASTREAQLLAEAKVGKLEDKLQSKREELADIKEQLDKRNTKLEKFKEDNESLAVEVAQLKAKIGKTDGEPVKKAPSSSPEGRKAATRPSSSPEATAKAKRSSRSPEAAPEPEESKAVVLYKPSVSPEKEGQEEGSDKVAKAIEDVKARSASSRSRSRSGSPRDVKDDKQTKKPRAPSDSRSGTGSPKRRGNSESRSVSSARSERRDRGKEGRRERRRERSRGGDHDRSRERDRRGRRGDDRSRGRGRRDRSCSRSRSERAPWREKGGKGKGKGKKDKDSDRVPLCINYVMSKCLNGDKCRDRHPTDQDCQEVKDTLLRKPCRYGDNCKRKDCIFTHPEREGGGGKSRSRSAQ